MASGHALEASPEDGVEDELLQPRDRGRRCRRLGSITMAALFQSSDGRYARHGPIIGSGRDMDCVIETRGSFIVISMLMMMLITLRDRDVMATE